MDKLLLQSSNLPRHWAGGVGGRIALICATVVLISSGVAVLADQVEMQNGDRYVGKVLSLSTDVLVMDNEVLGKVKLPRGKVAQITLGTGAVATTTQTPSTNGVTAQTNSVASAKTPAASPLPRLKPGTNVVQQVQDQYLGDATPEAREKYQQ